MGSLARRSTSRSGFPEGQYLGELYDIGFDKPETHAIPKGDRLYYAFYAPEYRGTLELRRLAARAAIASTTTRTSGISAS